MGKKIICSRQNCLKGGREVIDIKVIEGVLLVTRAAQPDCFRCKKFLCESQ